MNNEQIKSLLLEIEDAPIDFSVIMSGKKSGKVNGLYKVAEREIILHNKNFNDDNLLIYTAVHEYAHHIHACKNGGKLSARAHTTEFWAIFHSLLEKAEDKKLYTNAYKKSDKLNELTNIIRERYIKQNGELFLELGRLLLQASELCREAGLRFEDYIDRVLCLPRSGARVAMKSQTMNLNPALGQDNMRFVSAISRPDERKNAQNALLSGKSVDTVKMNLRPAQNLDTRSKLENEKSRIVRTIETLTKRLSEVEKELNAHS